jgi:hypothetical protein
MRKKRVEWNNINPDSLYLEKLPPKTKQNKNYILNTLCRDTFPSSAAFGPSSGA